MVSLLRFRWFAAFVTGCRAGLLKQTVSQPRTGCVNAQQVHTQLMLSSAASSVWQVHASALLPESVSAICLVIGFERPHSHNPRYSWLLLPLSLSQK